MQHRKVQPTLSVLRLTLGFITTLALSACSGSPSRGSEEYWFNKLQMEQRAQCSQLPEPLASNCLADVAKRSYQDFVRERSAAKNQP